MATFDPLSIPLDSSQMIEASAGTGKTYTITNLCLRLLLGRDLPWDTPLAIDQILILTFTIAATDELKDRIGKRIHAARRAYRTGHTDDDFLARLVRESTDPSRDLKLLTAASQLIDDASIFTIHGFCARVLGEQAFESGSLFNAELNAERDHLLMTAAEDCFRQFILPLDDALRSVALSMWKSPSDLATGLSPYLFRGELVYYPPHDAGFDPLSVVSDIRTIKTRWVAEELESLLASSGLARNKKPYRRLAQMTAFCLEPDIDLTTELWEIYTADCLVDGTRKSESVPSHPVLDMINTLPARLVQLKANIWHEAKASVTGALADARETRHLMTVDDLLTNLAAAINREGSTLPAVLRNRWPVAMIDEFQDTDNIQTSIFSPIYLDGATDSTLLMIGDPKQAIYGFRGADIFTYINTRRDSADQHNLSVNWRSSPDMIRATNELFEAPGTFGDFEDIQFTPVTSPEQHAGMAITTGDRALAPYQLFIHEPEENQGTVGIDEAREVLMGHAADEAAALLNNPGTMHVDDQPVNAGQIAFLVRGQKDAFAARRALAARGIRSVYLTLESVFLQDTADDLKLVLEAILEPGNDLSVRSALATRLMQTPAEDIDRLSTDINLQQEVAAEFREYHDLWLEKDIARMLTHLLEQRRLAAKWLHRPEGERQLTNFRHLAELLQQQSAVTPGMHQLVKWFGREQRDAETVSAEERQLRLESDENLVKIVTMHAAKGLEYDIVMIPMTVFGSPPERVFKPWFFHEENEGRYHAAAAISREDRFKPVFQAEEAAEEMRLLYVALTRARYRCYLGIPRSLGFAGSAIARLLGLSSHSRDDGIRQALTAKMDKTLFEITAADNRRFTIEAPDVTGDEIPAPPAWPVVNNRWQIHSYSAVTSRLSRGTEHVVTGFSDDDTQSDVIPSSDTRNRHTFPRGARVGIALHSLMEDVDFQAANNTDLVRRTIRRLGLGEEWLEVLDEWLIDILNTSLDDFCLADIPRGDRLDEMEFHFTLSSSTGLARFLAEHGVIDESINRLDLQGQMTGLVDLLFRRQGRYYIIDYKSNHLGWSRNSYRRANLEQAMNHHQYHLQYLIYSVALHRMLKQRLPGYDHEAHFGGVCYLFLRGMHPGGSEGVYSTRPSRHMIEQLDNLLQAPV